MYSLTFCLFCVRFCLAFTHKIWRWSKSTSGGSLVAGLLTRLLLTTMDSLTTLWLVTISKKTTSVCKKTMISRLTAVPSCLPHCSSIWWSLSWLFPRSLNMSITSSPGDPTLSLPSFFDRVISKQSKKRVTWQIGQSNHCVGLSDVSSPLLGRHFCPVPPRSSCQIWFPFRFLRAVPHCRLMPAN